MARFPTASTTSLAFVAEGQLWSVPRRGGRAVRLTNDPGQVLAPHFAPDGRSIAFTWRRGGANDVYAMPAEGGTPVRLTHGPSAAPYDNLVTGWTPDGRSVLFVSQRTSALGRYETFAVPATGGLATSLGIGHSGLSSMSRDGSRIAFDWSFRNLGGDRWKGYRGGQAGELFIFDRRSRQLDRLTSWDGIDTAPMWVGNRIYFLSDRGPEHRLNLWAVDLRDKAARQVTRYRDYDIDMPSLGPGGIAFQQGGMLRLLDPRTDDVRDVPVTLPPDRGDAARLLAAKPFVQHEDIAGQPDYALGVGGTAFVVARGDIFAVGADGAWRNLTATPGHVEDHPAVSPDGRALAFVSDADGEQQVAILPLDRPGRPHVLTRFHSGWLYTPRWSPDGRRLTVADANKRLWLVAADGRATMRIAFDPQADIQDAAFSPDSRLLAYSVTRANQTRGIRLRDLASGKEVVLSAPLESDHDPVFTADGRDLLFLSARREHPFVSDRDREGTIATLGSDGLYRASLPPPGADPSLFAASTREVPVKLAGGIASLQVRGERLFYLATPLHGIEGDLPGQASGLHAVHLGTHADRVIAADVDGYVLAGDGNAALVDRTGVFHAVATTDRVSEDRALNLDPLRVTVVPAAERHEMFEQAWRLDRDLFWDPRMNGVDWQAMHDRYAPLVVQARSHEDMIYLLGELQGELSTSHMFLGRGDSGDPRPRAGTAMLGVDFALDEASGRYRMAHVYRGDGSRERFRAPLGDPALGIADGDYLLAVDGDVLRAPDDPYRLLADRRGPLRLTIARNAEDPGRIVTVDPIDDEHEIRKLDWIAGRKAMVARLSDGRFGYLYLSDFNELGAEDFLRQYYAQSDKVGLVIDDRDNRGGFTSQWVLGLLRRPQAGIFVNREGGVTTLPAALSPPRLVTLTSIFSASDGDQFPYFFGRTGLGPVVGQRTHGGVRGIKGLWPLVDGTMMTVPKDSLLTPSGRQILENRGAEPDIVEDDLPVGSSAEDRQLERAVEVLSQTRPRG